MATWADFELTGDEIKAGRENELARFDTGALTAYITRAKAELEDDLRRATLADPTTAAGVVVFDQLATDEPQLIKRAWQYKALALLYSDYYAGDNDLTTEKYYQYNAAYKDAAQNFKGLLRPQGQVKAHSVVIMR